jgi:hypothetical protein
MTPRIVFAARLLLLCAGAVAARARTAGAQTPQAPSGQSAVDDSDARPPVSPADLLIVRRARTLLNTPAQWNRADTRKCPPAAVVYSLYCALEQATREVTHGFAHRGVAMQEARFVIDSITNRRPYEHRLMDFNNDSTTTFADVQTVWRVMEARLAARLR